MCSFECEQIYYFFVMTLEHKLKWRKRTKSDVILPDGQICMMLAHHSVNDGHFAGIFGNLDLLMVVFFSLRHGKIN